MIKHHDLLRFRPATSLRERSSKPEHASSVCGSSQAGIYSGTLTPHPLARYPEPVARTIETQIQRWHLTSPGVLALRVLIERSTLMG